MIEAVSQVLSFIIQESSLEVDEVAIGVVMVQGCGYTCICVKWFMFVDEGRLRR